MKQTWSMSMNTQYSKGSVKTHCTSQPLRHWKLNHCFAILNKNPHKTETSIQVLYWTGVWISCLLKTEQILTSTGGKALLQWSVSFFLFYLARLIKHSMTMDIQHLKIIVGVMSQWDCNCCHGRNKSFCVCCLQSHLLKIKTHNRPVYPYNFIQDDVNFNKQLLLNWQIFHTTDVFIWMK